MSWGTAIVLVVLAMVSKSSSIDSTEHNSDPILRSTRVNVLQYDEEYLRNVHSMIDAYKRGVGRPIMMETNAFVDNKYHKWKRNLDIIHAILGLPPKKLFDAGR